MERTQKSTKSERLYSWFKTIFMVFLVIQLAPVFFSGIRSTLEDLAFPKTYVGYLPINGQISDATFYSKKIDEFLKNDDVKALLLRINSPGGYSGSCQAVFNELKKFKEKKPIVAVIENIGASGAYYLAVAANTIVASPMSIVGSIGVFMELPNVKDLLNSWKIHHRYIQSGTYKTAGSPVKEISADEIAYLQKLSDAQYDQFINDVSSCRALNVKDHKVWADGKVFSGSQALGLHLIDKLGSISDALDEIKRIAKIEDEIKLIHAKRQPNFMRLLSGDDEFGQQDSVSASDAVAHFLSNVLSKISLNSQDVVQTR